MRAAVIGRGQVIAPPLPEEQCQNGQAKEKHHETCVHIYILLTANARGEIAGNICSSAGHFRTGVLTMSSGLTDDAERTLGEANLPIERAAALIALAEGLAAIGRLRTGKRAGQISLHNFQLRAAYDEAAEGSPLVVLMRAGVFRRHTWFMWVQGLDGDGALELRLRRPLERDWDWWPAIEEIQGRLSGRPAWREAVGMEPAEAVRAVRERLAGARVRMGREEASG